MPLKAYRVTTKWFPNGIYAATSAPKAKYASWRKAHEVGYDITFGEMKVRRAPEYDALMAQEPAGIGYAEDFLKAHYLPALSPTS